MALQRMLSVRPPTTAEPTVDNDAARGDRNVYRIWAAFEAKPGEEASFGLSRTRTSWSRMSAADKAEVRAEAEDLMDLLKERAKRTGTPGDENA